MAHNLTPRFCSWDSRQSSVMDAESQDEYFMRCALEQAQIAMCTSSSSSCTKRREPEVPVGCVFVHTTTSEIIGNGFNLTNLSQNATRHAEMVAIDDILFRQRRDVGIFKECDLYVTCEPCIMCAAALAKLQIRRVCYGCSNERFGGNGSVLSIHINNDGDNEETLYSVTPGVLQDEAIRLFHEFYKLENSRAPEEKRKRKIDNTSYYS